MIGGVESPSASVNFGSAGLAYAMLRMAQQRQDGSLLAVADVWSEAALRDVQAGAATAFTAPDLEMSPALVGHERSTTPPPACSPWLRSGRGIGRALRRADQRDIVLGPGFGAGPPA